jgi:hypothetical protein
VWDKELYPLPNHIIQENKKEKDTTLCFLSQNLQILVQTLNKKTKKQKNKNNTKNPIGLCRS